MSKPTMTDETQAKEVMLIAKRIAEFAKSELAGHSPNVQGAILADLLAMWLVDHFLPGDEAATAMLREDMLKMHVKQVRRLVEINRWIMREPQTGPKQEH